MPSRRGCRKSWSRWTPTCALEVPLAELAVQDPDYKRLIAFLKAMEFVTLTRRVAEFSGLDAAQVEADGKLKAGASRAAGAAERRVAAPTPSSSAESREEARRGSGATQGRQARRRPSELTPQSLAAARVAAAHNAKVDRSRYEIVRSLERLNAWIARARERGMVAIDTQTTSLDPMQAALCGFSLAVGANEAVTCRSPTAGAARRKAACLPARSRPIRSRTRRRWPP